MRDKIRLCERCGQKYNLKDAYFFRKDSKGRIVKIYSELSYKYCNECIPYFEKEALKLDNI
ncbi:MAG: hypothetical protein KatS3mg068_1698 [Candidatus Sericytochromatia bacterium]|nr:MAG: hypothetical protein KatS3mg068_1698 [Candidatus Sericytochromatia bacterium]